MSKSTIGLRRAGLATLAVSLTMGGALVAAPAQADWADYDATSETNGEIGLVDTSTAAGTQGATLVYPGVAGQDLGDVRLLIPNEFKNGDTIDLTIFDRTATAASNGQINADAAHRLGFGGVPTVTVNPTPHAAVTNIGPTSADADNTEAVTQPEAADPYVDSTPGVTDPATDVPTTPPVFTAELVESSRANGLAKDIIRLRVSGVQANNSPDAEWVVTLSDLTVTLGDAVSPGELRVVPFAYNGTPASNFSNASDLFQGNLADSDGIPGSYDPVINIYTVPGYVSPVTFNVGAPNNLVADGTPQRIGDVTISETNNYSLQGGTYTVDVAGATIRNDLDSPVAVTTTGGGGDTVTSSATVGDANGNGVNDISFTLTEGATSDSTKVNVILNGLLLSTNDKGGITYTLHGGSIDDNTPPIIGGPAPAFLVTAGMSDEIGTPPPPTGVYADSAFSEGVNQTDIVAPGLSRTGVATSLPLRLGGGDRYETAAKIALFNGSNDYVVLASGENFPDALSSSYLSQQVGGGSILLTKSDSLPQPTLSAMRELGTRTVFVVGGPSAVSNAVLNQLKNTPQYYPGGEQTIGQGKLHVVRLAGDDRYDTNREINEYAVNTDLALSVGRTVLEFGESSKITALLATGEDYADALSAGPATAGGNRGRLPLILTRTGMLSPDARAQLNGFGIEQVVVVGGPSAVSAAVVSELEGMGIDVLRVAGANRYETATKMADFEQLPCDPTAASTTGGLCFDSDLVFLATGQKFADALAGGPLAAGSYAPMLLTTTDSLSPETQTWLSGHAAQIDDVIALGLAAAVSNNALQAANTAISGG